MVSVACVYARHVPRAVCATISHISPRTRASVNRSSRIVIHTQAALRSIDLVPDETGFGRRGGRHKRRECYDAIELSLAVLCTMQTTVARPAERPIVFLRVEQLTSAVCWVHKMVRNRIRRECIAGFGSLSLNPRQCHFCLRL